MSRTLFAIPAILFFSLFASASSNQSSFQVKVLHAESHTVQRPPVILSGCDQEDLNGYCDSSIPEPVVENTMVVQKPDGSTLQIACAQDTAPHCVSLPANQSYSARQVKRGLEIRFSDAHEKLHKQVYDIVNDNSSRVAGGD